MIKTSVPKGSRSAEGCITTLSRIRPLAPAFSLMEMMVIMLVVAVVMAIAAPMLTKRIGGSGAGGTSLLTSIEGGNVAYNMSGQGRTVMLGGKDADIAQMAQYTGGVSYLPRITIQGKPATNPNDNAQIGFIYSGAAAGTMLVGNNNRIYIGNQSQIETTVKNAIAIGQGIKAQDNSVLIGGMFPTEPTESENTMNAASAVAIGFNVNAGSSAVTIGAHASTNIDEESEDDPGLIAIGESAIATTNAVAVGKKTQSSGSGVAIGTDARSSGGIAIGPGASVGSGLAIGGSCSGSGDVIGRTSCSSGMTLGGRSNMIIDASNKFFSTSGSTSFSSQNTLTLDGGDSPVAFSSSLTVTNDIVANTIQAGTISTRGESGVEDGLVTAKNGSFSNINNRYTTNMKILERYLSGLRATINSIPVNHFDTTGTRYTYTTITNCSCSADSGLAKFAFKNAPIPMLAYNYTSDERLKDIIGENLDAMDKINRLKVYDFTFKDDESKTKHVGVIAQELQKVFPNAVEEGEDGYLRIRHEDIFYAMIRALQELDLKVKKITDDFSENVKLGTENKTAISELKKQMKAQDKEIIALKKEIASLKKIVKKVAKDK